MYSVIELCFKGPEREDISADSVCLWATIDKQQWAGYHVGGGDYVVRYSPKAPGGLTYSTASAISELDGLSGAFSVSYIFPGEASETDYRLGEHWYADRTEQDLFEGKWQGAKTTRKWRKDVLEDWALRWQWLSEE